MFSPKHPPKAALKLLNWLLPEQVKDDILGDLQEEFHQSEQSPQAKQLWFWRQSITTCMRYNMNSKTLTSLALATLSISIFYALLTAIVFLSNGIDEVFNKDYWSSGALHLFFAEPIFWQNLSGQQLNQVTPALFGNTPSIVWAGLGLTAIKLLNNRYKMGLKVYSYVALLTLTLPYIWGVFYFSLNTVPLKQSGPIIAFMWLPILFLILPLGFGLISKIRKQAVY